MYKYRVFLFISSNNIRYRFDATCRIWFKATKNGKNLENTAPDLSIMCDNKYLIHNDKQIDMK